MPRSERSDQRPRVLYLLTNHVSTIFVRGQLGAVRGAGFDVHLATNFDGSSSSQVDDGIPTWSLPFERDPAPLKDLRALWATVLLMRRVRPDIVHAGTPKAGLLGMLAAWVCRVPVRCYALHGLRYETTSGRLRRMLLALERLACACATVVLADSESIRAVAVRDGLARSTKVTVLGSGSSNGVDTQRFSPTQDKATARRELGLERFDVLVGFVGRLTHDKGIDDLVSIVVDRLDDERIGLLLVGPREDADPLDALTLERIEHHPRIVWLRWLDDTSSAYHAMDVLAFLSYREGLPNVPLEAQACGVPVIGYAATGTVDACAPEARLVEPGDVDGAAVALGARCVALPDAAETASIVAWVGERFDRHVVWESRVDFFRSALRGASASTDAR